MSDMSELGTILGWEWTPQMRHAHKVKKLWKLAEKLLIENKKSKKDSDFDCKEYHRLRKEQDKEIADLKEQVYDFTFHYSESSVVGKLQDDLARFKAEVTVLKETKKEFLCDCCGEGLLDVLDGMVDGLKEAEKDKTVSKFCPECGEELWAHWDSECGFCEWKKESEGC